MDRASDRLLREVSMRTFHAAYGPTSPVLAMTYASIPLPRKFHFPDSRQTFHHSENVKSHATPRCLARDLCSKNRESADLASSIDSKSEIATWLRISNEAARCDSTDAPYLESTFSTAVQETPQRAEISVISSPDSKSLTHLACLVLNGAFSATRDLARSDFPPSKRVTPSAFSALETACLLTPEADAISSCVIPERNIRAQASCFSLIATGHAPMTYSDPPEVLRDAATLEALPDWYLALMLARLLNRKTPARSTETGRHGPNLNRQGLKATTGGGRRGFG